MTEHATRMIRNTPRGVQSELAHLVVVDSPGTDLTAMKGRAYRLFNTRPTKVGRLPENDIILGDDSVSRRHCELTCDEGGWHIRDLGSANGTQVGFFQMNPAAGLGGMQIRPIESAKLGKFDVIQVGEFRLVFWGGNFNDPDLVRQLKNVGVTQLSDGNKSVDLEAV